MKLFFCTLVIVISIPLFAGTKTFIREYTYTAGEADSKITSRAIALDQVKRILLEEIGVYLQSEMTTIKEEKNKVYNELTKQQIQSITAGITETKIVVENWNGEKYYIKASISVDPDEVNKNIARIGADQSKLKELEDVKRIADDAFAEIERLRKELASTKSENDKLTKQKEYIAASNTLSASDLFQRGYSADELKDYGNAVLYFQKAIELKPDYADAYNNRGVAKNMLEDYQGAIADFTKTIELRPDDAYAYNNRGNAKSDLKDYQGAITDYTRAIKLRPDDADAYYNRGVVKGMLEDRYGAIVDHTKAIRLKPDFAESYYSRGISKDQLKDYHGAIGDYTQAIRLRPNFSDAYYLRGIAYIGLDQKSKALADFMRAIELGEHVPQEALDMCK